MAQYATLKAAITAYVKTNGAQGITGQGLQNILVGMVDILGKYFQNFGGLATPAGSFTAGDENVSFLAIEAGTYTNFGGVTLDGKSLHVLVYDGNWDDIDTGIATSLALAETLADYAKVDGNYPQLTAGRAKNIDGKSTIEGTFLFRTTAGDAEVATGPATVQEVKGNTVAWNQLIKNGNFANTNNWTVSNGTLSASGNIGTITVANTGNSYLTQSGLAIINGHKYLFAYDIKGSNPAISSKLRLYGAYTETEYSIPASFSTHTAVITASADSSTLYLLLDNVTADDTVEVRNMFIIDLTLKGKDNLTTVAQVESWLAANVGNKPYYPASSKLLPTKLLGLKTRGFNQWDEENERGSYDLNTGLPTTYANNFRTKNPIGVLPSTPYYMKTPYASFVLFYDSAGNYITPYAPISAGGGAFTTPAGCAFVRFTVGASGADYNHDICINFSWDGSKDGEYEPYVEHSYNLDVTKFYGKLNGEGDLTQIFPNGMRKAGSVYDLLDLVNAEAYVKLDSQDLGDLTWAAESAGDTHERQKGTGLASVIKHNSANNVVPALICAPYVTASPNGTYTHSAPNIITVDTSGIIYIYDTALIGKTGEQIATALDGKGIFFELATPLHYTDLVYRDNGVDTPVEALNILVDNWSTEEEIIAAPEASGDPNSCAATLDILYGIDAAEQLDTINQSGIFTTDLKANLEALLGVINTNCAEALGGTLSISENPSDKVYSFTFTPNA